MSTRDQEKKKKKRDNTVTQCALTEQKVSPLNFWFQLFLLSLPPQAGNKAGCLWWELSLPVAAQVRRSEEETKLLLLHLIKFIRAGPHHRWKKKDYEVRKLTTQKWDAISAEVQQQEQIIVANNQNYLTICYWKLFKRDVLSCISATALTLAVLYFECWLSVLPRESCVHFVSCYYTYLHEFLPHTQFAQKILRAERETAVKVWEGFESECKYMSMFLKWQYVTNTDRTELFQLNAIMTIIGIDFFMVKLFTVALIRLPLSSSGLKGSAACRWLKRKQEVVVFA